MKKSSFLLLTAFVIFSGCGPQKDEGGTTSRERESRDRAQQVYSQFVGLYRGEVVPTGGGRPEPVEMELRVVEVRSGVNENNEPEFRPELRGYFHPTNFDLDIIPQARRNISGRYYEDRNQLILSQPEQSEGRYVRFVSITGTFNEGKIEGDISYAIVTPVFGRISVQRVRE